MFGTMQHFLVNQPERKTKIWSEYKKVTNLYGRYDNFAMIPFL